MKKTLFPLIALSFPCFVFAEQLPDAAQVAGQIGGYVKFEDTIRAVSKARTHDGFYLSFGAPYPKQVLTVWVPSKLIHYLPKPALERKVRISGMLQKTDTGLMLGLMKPDQIEVLPQDESILSKKRIEGSIERHQFVAAIWELLKREDFDTIETLGRELHQTKERSSDGVWLLDPFFSALSLSPNASNERYIKRAQTLADWRARYPQSILPTLAEAKYHVDIAWKWRGIGLANTVTKEGWINFRRELAEARQILEANPQAKSSPYYLSVMQNIALGQAWPRENYFRLFDEAISREPDYYDFYRQAANYLLPKWFGKEGDWEKFAREQRGRRGGAEGDVLYTRIAWSVESEYHNHLFDRGGASWEIMAAGFDALMREYPDSFYLKNVYAHFAWEARDRLRLLGALAAVKQHSDMDVWVNLENVQFAEKFANNESPPATR